MSLTPIPLSESFFNHDPSISAYDCIFPVVKLNNKREVVKLIGTCFAIASCGIYATAAHLFDEFTLINNYLRDQSNPLRSASFNKEELLRADNMMCGIVHFRRQDFLGITLVDALTMCVKHDVAVLFAANDLRGRLQPFLPIIETPTIEDRIQILGYPGSHNGVNMVGGNPAELEFDIALVSSEGKIIELFEKHRDSVLAHFPCFTTTATMRSGHSGGPVLSLEQMGVMGINSRSFDEVDNYSVVSWLGKALDEPIDFEDCEIRHPNGTVIPLKRSALRRLGESGVISIK